MAADHVGTIDLRWNNLRSGVPRITDDCVIRVGK